MPEEDGFGFPQLCAGLGMGWSHPVCVGTRVGPVWDLCGTCVGPVWPGMAEGSGAWGWLEHSLQRLCEETPAKAEIQCSEGAVAWTGLAPVPHP